MAVPGRIDVHHHFLPPLYRKELQAMGDPSGWKAPEWTEAADKEFSKSEFIATRIISLTAPGPGIVDDIETSVKIARDANEYAASLRDRFPDKYGFFASVSNLMHVDVVLAEIGYALDTLHADGVVLFTRYGPGHQYLGHPDFAPIWTELNRRKAVVFIHPTHAVDTVPVNPMMPGPLIDYPHETCRTAVDLILSNTVRQNPDCKIILPHGGGTFPYLASRSATLAEHAGFGQKTVEEFMEDAKSFYYDTALATADLSLELLKDFARPGHILFGSDYPYAPVKTIRYFCEHLDDAVMSDEEKQAINRNNALKLFPRLEGQ